MYNTKKSRKGLWITLITIFVIIALALTVFFVFFRNVGPLLSLSRAFQNLNTEAEERFSSTPLRALTMLPEVLEDGVVTVSFDYTTAIFGEWLTATIDGKVRLLSNTEDRNFALEAEVGMYGQTLDIEAYMNRERLAAGIQLLSDDHIGITYNTFRDDIRVFGNQVGLSTQEMDTLADIVDQINAIMNMEEASEEAFDPYKDVLTEFARNLRITSRRTHIESGNDRIRCTEIKIKITKEAILSLIIDVYSIIKEDEAIRAQFGAYNNLSLQNIFENNISDYDEFLREYKIFINEFKSSYSGEVEVLFYVSNEDKLLRAELTADMEYDGERSELNAEFDFGNSINDTWVMNSRYNDSESDRTISILWSFEERSDNRVNTINVIHDDPTDSITVISEWDEKNGDFMLAYIEGKNRSELTGILTIEDKNFRIKLDDIYPEDSSDRLLIEISTETGAQIKEISYINIDRWGYAMMEALMSLIINGLF